MLGVGNPLFADDGLGYCVIRGLEECSSRPECLDIVAVQALEPGLVALFEGKDHVIVVDIVDPRMLPRGAKLLVLEFDPTRLEEHEIMGAMLEAGSHELNPAMLALLGRAAGLFNGRLTLLGIPGFNIELGGTVSREALQLLDTVVKEVSRRVSSICCEELRIDMECFWSVVRSECNIGSTVALEPGEHG